MDPGVLIPLAGIGIGGLAIYLGHQRKMMELKLKTGTLLNEHEQLGYTIKALRAEQKALEQRIEQLEVIATVEPAKPLVDLPPMKEHLEQLKTAGKVRNH